MFSPKNDLFNIVQYCIQDHSKKVDPTLKRLFIGVANLKEVRYGGYMSIQLSVPNYSQTFLNHRGLNFAVYEWGTPSNHPTILFIHGWLDHGSSWNTTANHLIKLGYHCVAIDHRGHGCSDHIPMFDEYHFPDYISDLQALITLLNLTKFVMVGHSMGGTIASLYGAFCIQRAVLLVLIDGLGPEHEEPESARHRFRLHLKQREKIPTHKPMTEAIGIRKLRRIHPFLSESSLQQELTELTVRSKEDSNHVFWRWDPRHRNKAAIGFDLRRYLEILKWIETETVLIFGEHSWYLQLPDIPQRIKHIPTYKSTILLPSGHSPHLECPEILASSLDKAIQNIGKTNAPIT